MKIKKRRGKHGGLPTKGSDVINTLDELKILLDSRFPADLGISREEISLVSPGESEVAVTEFENKHGYRFPVGFRNTIKTYKFGKLSLSYINFGNSESYLDGLQVLNTNETQGQLPPHCIFLAFSDNHVIVLDTVSGLVFAIERGKTWEQAEKIADAFDDFLKITGQIAIGGDLASEVDLVLSESSFWFNLKNFGV